MNFFLKTVFCLLLSLNFFCSKNIIIGTSIDYPPFEYSSLGYKIVGFDIDLIEAIAKKRGLKFKIVNLAYDELIPNLINGKIDIIASALSITNERIKLIDFTNPYFETENIYIKNKNNKLINSKEDLKGKKIGVIKGMQQENSIKEEIQNAKIVTFSNASNAVMALSFGDIDALILDFYIHWKKRIYN